MYLAYCDEQDCHQEMYSAAVACLFDSAEILDYRKDLVSLLRRVFRRDETNWSPFRELHASALPNILTDDGKSSFSLALFN